MMSDDPQATRGSRAPQIHADLKTPRAAAIAGVLFSVLFTSSYSLLRLSIPADPHEKGAWLETGAERVSLALNLMPFAGIAFLWFIGVLRDRLGALEDRFFATVFLGSALLFLGMMFVAAAATGGLMGAYSAEPAALFNSAAFAFGRAFTFDVTNIYAIKMAAVFMITASTLAVRTDFIVRWIALLGYVFAAFILLGSGYFAWASFVFPFWVLLVSGYILIDNLTGTSHQRLNDAAR
jgi:hypothetical protein